MHNLKRKFSPPLELRFKRRVIGACGSRSLTGFIFLVFLCLVTFTLAFAEPIAIIVNNNNPEDNISLSVLNNIFTKKMSIWPNKVQVFPINRQFGVTIREAFSKIVHGKSPQDMQGFWFEMQYNGIRPPATQESGTGMKRMVSSIDGAIGYIYLSEVDDTVKVLAIDGVKPADAGYRIKE